jgi:molybdopterin molybdotransferase
VTVHDHGDPAELLPLDRYRRDVLARVAPLDPIALGLLEARGCVLAEDVVAESALPPFPNSAMDGYAVRADDAHAGAELKLVGEVAAGAAGGVSVSAGETVRIMTGAPIPDGADAVVPVEQTTEVDGRVTLRAEVAAGAHVRPAGESVHAGATVLEAGRILDASALGLLAALGRNTVQAHPRPRVVVISTGDELVEPGRHASEGQIYDANSVMLTAMCRDAGANTYRHAPVPDDRQALTEAFEGALVQADLLVTTGGVSAGRYDYVKEVLAELGDVRPAKVGMKPGMPQAFGHLAGGDRRVPCFGLPGNPVSAFVSFEVFVRPAIRRLQGRSDLTRPRIVAALEEDVDTPVGKVTFVRVRMHQRDGRWQARPTGPQGSGVLSSIVEADGLAEIPAERGDVPAGDGVVVHLLVGG